MLFVSAAVLITIFRGLAASAFGIVMVNTPLSNEASIRSPTMCCGKRSERVNEPQSRSAKKTSSSPFSGG